MQCAIESGRIGQRGRTSARRRTKKELSHIWASNANESATSTRNALYWVRKVDSQVHPNTSHLLSTSAEHVRLRSRIPFQRPSREKEHEEGEAAEALPQAGQSRASRHAEQPGPGQVVRADGARPGPLASTVADEVARNRTVAKGPGKGGGSGTRRRTHALRQGSGDSSHGDETGVVRETGVLERNPQASFRGQTRQSMVKRTNCELSFFRIIRLA